MPDVSIIIVNWNTRDVLANCLKSLYSTINSETRVETIVVDNASDDNSSGLVSEQFPDVKFIENKENVGFAAANNIGILLSSGQYILFLNPDTYFTEDCVTPILRKMLSDDTIGLMGCKLENPDRTHQWSGDVFPYPLHEINPFSQVNRRVVCRRIREAVKIKQSCDVGCLIGAFQIVPRGLIVEIGMLDASLFMYGEDLDLCYRIKMSGRRVVFDGSTSIVHLGGQSAGQVWTEYIRYGRVRESIFRIHCKHFGVGLALISLFARVILGWLRLVSAFLRPVGSTVRQSYKAEAVADSRTLLNVANILAAIRSSSR